MSRTNRNKLRGKEKIISAAVFYYDKPPYFPGDCENICREFIGRGENFDFKHRWRRKGEPNSLEKFDASPDGTMRDSTDDFENWYREVYSKQRNITFENDQVFIFSRNDRPVESVTAPITKLYPGRPPVFRIVEIGENHRVIALGRENRD